MTKYQITTYDGTVHTIEGNTQQEVKRMVEFFRTHASKDGGRHNRNVCQGRCTAHENGQG